MCENESMIRVDENVLGSRDIKMMFTNDMGSRCIQRVPLQQFSVRSHERVDFHRLYDKRSSLASGQVCDGQKHFGIQNLGVALAGRAFGFAGTPFATGFRHSASIADVIGGGDGSLPVEALPEDGIQ